MDGARAVETWLDSQTPEVAAMCRRLRALALAAAADVGEHVKWNAPSFTVGGDDRITLGVERKGGVRAVLHRGARSKPDPGFVFDDPETLANWPSPDRGVLIFDGPDALEVRTGATGDLFRRWLDATR